ncbi:MAG TPA: bifunctional demethylmenaquinone methyltransferase/2-methoxy-6-polyprenyl-1,4-benzoquinol methylase UbiE [Saprospiraceae bacterium]|nr:bifunctional demethylmenaquinone methyltransferase/2-methoxy-6-polyprenyl-1,4-benzoquinol methylase UbiE [Saprospiraceae bacterium]
MEEIKPYKTDHWDKKEEVEQMFDNISGKYDLLNKVLSLGTDRNWRKKALSMLIPIHPEKILDVATGTGDMAFMSDKLLGPKSIIGVDLSSGMLEIARKRLKSKGGEVKGSLEFRKGDAEDLGFEANTFDAATVAFGVRNFADLQSGLKEMNRVLKPGAPIVVLEFTKPRIFPFRQLFDIYFRHILPLIGSWTSGDRRAYKYLYESVQAFPDFDAFNKELIMAGFEKPVFKSLSAGICAIYIAYKS